MDAPVVVGDLSSLANIKAVPEQVRSLGSIDVVIHNAGIYESGGRGETVDGLERTFQVNVLAPYVLSAFMPLEPYVLEPACRRVQGQIVSARWRRTAARVSTTGVGGRSGVRSIWLSQCRLPSPIVARLRPETREPARQFYREDRRVPVTALAS